jgi:hypothetical protein
MRVCVRGLTALRHHQPLARLVVAQGPDSPALERTSVITRKDVLDKALGAAARASTLAGHAESATHNKASQAQAFAEAGALWAAVARAHAAIAQAMPADETPED